MRAEIGGSSLPFDERHPGHFGLAAAAGMVDVQDFADLDFAVDQRDGEAWIEVARVPLEIAPATPPDGR